MSGSTVVVSDHFPSEAVVTVAMGTENEKWVCTKWVVKVIIEAPAPELASSHRHRICPCVVEQVHL